MLRAALALVPSAAAYGFALGSAHSWLYATRNLVKFPLLVVTTCFVTGFANWFAARVLGAPLSWRAVQGSVLLAYTDLAILLASLSPAVLLLGLVARSTDDGVLGEYPLFFAVNVAFVAVAGALALHRKVKCLAAEHGLSRPRSSRVVLAWLGLAVLVGGQASFWMRPFFGLPATRGGNPPFCLGSTPDVRGATNFYEMVWLLVERKPLPEALQRRSERR